MDKYKITIETFNKLAEGYQDKFMDVSLYHDSLDVFCRLITKPNAKVFEVGCGPGNLTKYLLSKRPDLIIEAIDMAPNMIELARKNNPGATFKIMDARDINIVPGKFDAIMCGFCMPYLSKEDCAKLVKDCSFLLHEGGVFYFSTMEGDYSKSGFEKSSNGQDGGYMYYHQENYLLKMMKENNFNLVKFKRQEFKKPDGTSNTDMIFIVKKRSMP
ncbi:MAG TPA: class I SAM-dependent methyltransferase [Bacteroidia bacterium]|jgi:2-polyprenyl-3-methyl-5-hydroxy-6-metoxy-1,4-benzoquinol methylase|nr:class I SAM-dependent methyltransferase [Bacteroidia bacterium]